MENKSLSQHQYQVNTVEHFEAADIFRSRARPVTLHLDDALTDDLDLIARVNGISRSETARWLLRFAVSVTLSNDPQVAGLVDLIGNEPA